MPQRARFLKSNELIKLLDDQIQSLQRVKEAILAANDCDEKIATCLCEYLKIDRGDPRRIAWKNRKETGVV